MYNTDMPTRAELPTSGQLLRSTLIAFAAAIVILVTIVLPAEYGIDPTGIGRTLGLAEMGEIKAQLAEEAEADRQGVPQSTKPEPSDKRSSLFSNIIANLLIGPAAARTNHALVDEVSITLEPGQGSEIKLIMAKDGVANFKWTVTGGVVNFDLHGDGGGKEISYLKGRGVEGHEGVITAAFDGNHGWFWRNRGTAPVTITLRTSGDYTDIKRME